MRRIAVIPFAVLFAGIFAGSAAPTHGNNPWSGQWTTNSGGIAFRWVSDSEGSKAIKSQGGNPCAEPTEYFRGGYTTTAGDAGKVTGCTIGERRMVARWKTNFPANNRNGTFDITSGNNSFSGLFREDGGSSGPYTGRFKGHFGDDGYLQGGDCPFFGGAYKFSFRTYANNVRVVAPLVGPWQLGIARAHGAGDFKVCDGKFVGNPGSISITFNPHGPKYADRSVKAKVIGFNSTIGAHQTYEQLTLKVQVTGSSHADEGHCPLGLQGTITLYDSDEKLGNGKNSDHVVVNKWFGKCPTFYMGWTNEDGGARTDPPDGGPPGGGQWAIVALTIRHN